MEDAGGELITADSEAQQQPTPPPQDSQVAGPAERHSMRSMKQMDKEEESAAPDMPSPISADGEKHDVDDLSALNNADLGSPSLSYDFSNVRVRVQLFN
jgi:glucose-induced degradation protein 4